MAELADMALFVRSIHAGSLSAAGRELGISAAVASKRLARLEAQLGVRLLQRNSRRLSLTDEGTLYFERCEAILAEVAEAESLIAQGVSDARGILRVSATSALGRRWVGPVAARFAALYPAVIVRLTLTEQVVDVIDAGLDCAVRVGSIADSRLIARRLAASRRVVCATPSYLQSNGKPKTPADLVRHACIVLTTSDSAVFADWTFETPGQRDRFDIRVHGQLVTDNGQQAHDWLVSGEGLARRSFWDISDELADGRLVEVLAEWSQAEAPISVVYPSRRFLPARTRLFIDALVKHFDKVASELPLCTAPPQETDLHREKWLSAHTKDSKCKTSARLCRFRSSACARYLVD